MLTGRSILTALCLVLVLGVSGLCQGETQPGYWFDQQYGQARVAAHLVSSDGERLLLDGQFRFKYPDDFAVDYPTTEGQVVISGHKDFVELNAAGEVSYGYDQHWLCDYFRAYVYEPASYFAGSLEPAGTTTLVGRPVDRYYSQGDRTKVLWLDQETGLPLLIREGDVVVAAVKGYTAGSDTTGPYNSLELEFQGEKTAVLTLVRTEETWAPGKLELEDSTGRLTIEFFEWDFSFDFTTRRRVDLQELRTLNERFFDEYSAENWAGALAVCQDMLSLAPNYWNVYLFQAFVYEALGDFFGVVENYQQVLMGEPDNVVALNNLAYHYMLREVQIEKAISMAERAVALERQAIYLDTLGYGYYLVGRYGEARELLEEALLYAPEEGVEEIREHLDLVMQALGEGE
ncbi:MAG: hypothetical protein WAQ48_02620 [Limnochordia bacterium]